MKLRASLKRKTVHVFRQKFKATKFVNIKACLNGSNIVGPTSSNNVTIIDMTASLSNLFG
jgi:hypothetical protein